MDLDSYDRAYADDDDIAPKLASLKIHSVSLFMWCSFNFDVVNDGRASDCNWDPYSYSPRTCIAPYTALPLGNIHSTF